MGSRERQFAVDKVSRPKALEPSLHWLCSLGQGIRCWFIKGHLKYGGQWKQEIHGRYTHAVITDEYVTSHTCIYCYSKLDCHTHKKVLKGKTTYHKSKGSFLCCNPNCILLRTRKSAKCRNDLSVMAIGLSGLAKVLFQEILPAFKTAPSQ